MEVLQNHREVDALCSVVPQLQSETPTDLSKCRDLVYLSAQSVKDAAVTLNAEKPHVVLDLTGWDAGYVVCVLSL